MEYTLTITINLYLLTIACLVLALFGIGYNVCVGYLKANGYDRGYMSLLVALGCAVTGLAYGLATSLWLLLPLAACFAAAGIPMAIGSITRHLTERAKAQRERDANARRHLED